jgi:hypothetical protein
MLFAKRAPACGDSFQNESAGPSVNCGSRGTGTAAAFVIGLSYVGFETSTNIEIGYQLSERAVARE